MRERIALVPGDIPAIPVASRPVVTLAGVIDVIASPLVPWAAYADADAEAERAFLALATEASNA